MNKMKSKTYHENCATTVDDKYYCTIAVLYCTI